ncbi:MAG: hypothetical protein AB7T49_01750 [Oligoflexales bacterium]
MRKFFGMIIWFWMGQVALGGPGSSGGTSSNFISNVKANYSFQFSYPSDIKFGDTHVYDFKLMGYSIEVQKILRTETDCTPISKYKTVCIKPFDDRVEADFLMSGKETFRVVFSSKVYQKERILEDFDVFALSFTLSKE